jgi:hypothetical protein
MIADDLCRVFTPTAPPSTISDPAAFVDMGASNPSGSVAERIKLIAFLPPRTVESSHDVFRCTHSARKPVDLGRGFFL